MSTGALPAAPATPQRRVLLWAHPAVPGVVGTIACAAVVVAAGQARTPVGMVLPRAFAGLLSPAHDGGTSSAAVVVVALAVLVVCWWELLSRAWSGRLTMRGSAWASGAWLVPLLVGPPLLSYDAYAYLAQGEMAAAGLDPYAAGPVALGADPVLERVDPQWRSSPSPYGPVALVALGAVALTDLGLVGSAQVVRLLAVVGVAAAVAGALVLSPPARRPLVLVLVLANPVTLVHLVGGAHLDALVSGLVVLALLALRSGRPWSALLLSAVAVACKVTVLPLFVLLALAVVRRRGARAVPLVLLVLVLPLAVTGLVLDRPWGFLGALLVSSAAAPWYAPASLAALVLRGAGALVGWPVPAEPAAVAGRVVIFAVGTAVVLRVLRDAWRETGHDPGPDAFAHTLRRAGWVLLVSALALPALYAWYLGPALFVLAAAASRRPVRTVVVLCSAVSFSSMPPMYDASWELVAAAWVVALGVLALGVRQHLPHPRVPPVVPARPKPTSGRLPRSLLVVTRVAELLVLPALVLAVTTSAQAVVVEDPARETRRHDQLRAVARVSAALSASYPEHQVVSVLPRGVPAQGARREFDVQLVVPGEVTCQLGMVVDGSGPAVRVPDAVGRYSGYGRGLDPRPCGEPAVEPAAHPRPAAPAGPTEDR